MQVNDCRDDMFEGIGVDVSLVNMGVKLEA